MTNNELSKFDLIKQLPTDKQQQLINSMTEEEMINFLYDWDIHARPKQKIPRGDWYGWLINAGRGFGKEIDINTPVLTHNRGWVINGNLQKGDILYGHEGLTTITDVHPIRTIYDAYEITFRNGEKIRASSTHLWTTINGYHFNKHKVAHGGDYRNGMKTITTEQIFNTPKYKNRYANHKIPTINQQGNEKKLPIEPYILGLWLGDGLSAGSYLTIGNQDFNQINNLLNEHNFTITKASPSLTYKLSPSIYRSLRENNILKNKHIPAEYLTASYQQRLELLRGLMDSDGHVCSQNYHWCEITQKNKNLHQDIITLISTLGVVVKDYVITARCDNYSCPVYRIHFKPPFNPFKLPRKHQTFAEQPPQTQQWRQQFNDIVDIKRCEPTQMRCISVDAADRLYAVGRTMILTHNTKCGSETVRYFVENNIYGTIALVNATIEDCHKVFIDGESGIIKTAHPQFQPVFKKNGRKIEWPNGAIAYIYTAEEPDAARGPQHDFVWFDELAKYRYQEDVYENFDYGLRLGKKPRWMATTTPRPTQLIRTLVKSDFVHVTTGSTFENTTLPQQKLDYWKEKYGGTRSGRQELYAEILDDNPNSLFQYDNFTKNRVKAAPDLYRVVVAVDPAGTSNKNSDDTGIIVVGKDKDNHGYVLDDFTVHGTPGEWSREVIAAYHKYGANEIVAETNYGGDMVVHTIHNTDRSVRVRKITATKGKALRAEPVSVLYEQNKIHHVGVFAELENEMTMFDPTIPNQKSPNRLDALVWGFTQLFNLAKPRPGIL